MGRRERGERGGDALPDLRGRPVLRLVLVENVGPDQDLVLDAVLVSRVTERGAMWAGVTVIRRVGRCKPVGPSRCGKTHLELGTQPLVLCAFCHCALASLHEICRQ